MLPVWLRDEVGRCCGLPKGGQVTGEILAALIVWSVLVVALAVSMYLRFGKRDNMVSEPEGIKVTVDDGKVQRLFAPWGDVVYKRSETREERPSVPGERWHKRIVTLHTLTWESISYE